MCNCVGVNDTKDGDSAFSLKPEENELKNKYSRE